MVEFIDIPGLAEARLPLNEYDKMRNSIRELEAENKRLTEMLDHICDENKVRVRRQIIRVRELTFNPHACGTQEIIEDKMVNMQDFTDELNEKLHALDKEWKGKYEVLESLNKGTIKTLEQCQRKKIELEIEVEHLKHRGWWDRLWNR